LQSYSKSDNRSMYSTITKITRPLQNFTAEMSVFHAALLNWYSILSEKSDNYHYTVIDYHKQLLMQLKKFIKPVKTKTMYLPCWTFSWSQIDQ